MIEIIYADVSVGAAENAAYTDTGKQEYSNPSLLSLGAYGKKIATGEVGRWSLDGTVDIYGATKQDYGYVSEEISDAMGAYSGDVGVDILFTELFTSTGLTITFDSNENVSYECVVRWYNGNTMLLEKTITGMDETVIEERVELFDKISIRFLTSSKPYRYARIDEVMYGIGRRFRPSDFEKASINQYVNPVSEDIMIDTSKFVLRPPRDLQLIFQTRQPFSILKDGKLLVSHYLDSATLTNGNKYDITCHSAIGVLDEQDFEAVMWFDKNAYEAAFEIVGDDFVVEMDTDLQSLTVTGHIAACTRRQALHQLLFALGAMCSTANTDRVRIFRYTAEAKTIGRDKVYTGVKIQQGAVVTAVEVEYHEYSTTSSNGAKQIEVGGVTYYDKVGILTKSNPNIVAGTKKNVKRISGATLITQDKAESLMDSLYDYYVNNAVVSEKILVNDETLGDTVRTHDFNAKPFIGTIISMQTNLTNKLASQIEVRGNYE